MKIQVDAMIPSSRLVPTSLNKGRPVVLDEPGAEVSQAIRQLAERFTEDHTPVVEGVEQLEMAAGPRKKRGLFGAFSKG